MRCMQEQTSDKRKSFSYTYTPGNPAAWQDTQDVVEALAQQGRGLANAATWGAHTRISPATACSRTCLVSINSSVRIPAIASSTA